MKLSRTAWNNVIIFSVMIIILLINTTNDKLFPAEKNKSSAEQPLLPEYSVILALNVDLSASEQVQFERVGRGWKMTAKGLLIDLSEQQIEQMMFAWQQSTGLIQAGDIIIDEKLATKVTIDLASSEQPQVFSLYPLNDQLLIYLHQPKEWLALPNALAQQLLPIISR